MKVIYVAGKYRGKNAWEVENNIRVAERAAFVIASNGMMPLCPHANSRFFHGTLTEEFWIEGTMELMRRCDAVYFCEDWDESVGSVGEMNEAIGLEMPIFEDIEELVEWSKSV